MDNFKIVAKNRKATFNYEILEQFDAGIVLVGSEVKSIRNGNININDAYVGNIQNSNELFLFNTDIALYDKATYNNHSPKRPRKLLLHRRQINKLLGEITKKGLTIIPLKLFFNNKGFLKITIGLAKGKNVVDKRETIKRRDWNVQRARIFKEYNHK